MRKIITSALLLATLAALLLFNNAEAKTCSPRTYWRRCTPPTPTPGWGMPAPTPGK